MEDNVKHNFLDPLAHLQQTDLKEVNHHRSKLKGRRLDYDCKKRKQTRDEELIQAEDKLEESKKLAEQAMYNLLSNDVEQVTQLCALVDAQLDFHRQTTQVLEHLRTQLNQRIAEASSRPRAEHVIKPVLTDRTPSTRHVLFGVFSASFFFCIYMLAKVPVLSFVVFDSVSTPFLLLK
ncbi:unnamed protein product [Gongylonema pulchrum]|uniref:BAR domain-containing protein n=1 Tax=Gongylonema pulchrum TaxID=637853 RepID=A0A183D1K9_9BILA|nr:unnamed protein product [Gongylonema pulchrum]